MLGILEDGHGLRREPCGELFGQRDDLLRAILIRMHPDYMAGLIPCCHQLSFINAKAGRDHKPGGHMPEHSPVRCADHVKNTHIAQVAMQTQNTILALIKPE